MPVRGLDIKASTPPKGMNWWRLGKRLSAGENDQRHRKIISGKLRKEPQRQHGGYSDTNCVNEEARPPFGGRASVVDPYRAGLSAENAVS